MFWIYWSLIILVLLGITIMAFKNQAVRKHVFLVIAQLTYNNNWRLVALLIVSIVLTISAILAGFGRPISAIAVDEAKTFVYENVAESNKIASASSQLGLAVGNIGKAFGFTNNTPATTQIDVAKKKVGKRYSSWWHWRLAIFSWACFWVYFPIATREELSAAIKKAWKMLKMKKHARSIINQPAVSAPTTTAETESPGLFGKLFPKGGFNWHMLIEILGDWFPAAVIRIIKKL